MCQVMSEKLNYNYLNYRDSPDFITVCTTGMGSDTKVFVLEGI